MRRGGECEGALVPRYFFNLYDDVNTLDEEGIQLRDQATAEVDSNFELRLKEREQKLLKKIDEALERIATNTYGICERCGEEIPYKRLKARPVTTLCIECKSQQEAEEKIRS